MARVAAEHARRDADGHAGPRLRGHAPRGRGAARRASSARSPSCTSGPTGPPAGGRRASRVPPTRRRCPKELDWDVWLGPAPERPYNPAYVPFKWRGFWDFGTGAIGDMGIHNLDTAFWGLELGAPTSVVVKDCSPALTDPATKETAPLWSIIELRFPARGERARGDDDLVRRRQAPAADLFQGEKLITKDGGSLVIGTKGTLFTRTWHGGQTDEDMFVLLPRKTVRGIRRRRLRRCRAWPSHHQEWVDACLGQGPDAVELRLCRRRSPKRCSSAISRCARARPSNGTRERMRATGARRPTPSFGPRSATGWSMDR